MFRRRSGTLTMRPLLLLRGNNLRSRPCRDTAEQPLKRRPYGNIRRTMPPKPPPELTDGQAAIWRGVVVPCREIGLHAAATRS